MRATRAARERASEWRSFEGPPPPTLSSASPLAQSLFTISPKWRSCSQDRYKAKPMKTQNVFVRNHTTDHFTLVGFVCYPLHECEAEVDFVSIQTTLLLLYNLCLKYTYILSIRRTWNSKQGCIKTRSTPASFSSVTVKWASRRFHVYFFF